MGCKGNLCQRTWWKINISCFIKKGIFFSEFTSEQLEHSDNHFMTSISWWNYYKVEVNDDGNDGKKL